MKTIIKTIIAAEFEQFQAVKNIDGRAQCQDDWKTFQIMRESQFSAWNDNMLLSYGEDLSFAASQGRNLLWEKYAHMMRSTDPQQYQLLKQHLPVNDEETMEMINEIVGIQVTWNSNIGRKYPYLSANGRPIYESQDSMYQTSFETYLAGELMTYSKKTLRFYLDHVHKLLEHKENMCFISLESIAKAYGYASIDEAEAMVKKSSSLSN